jgi:transketolase
MPDPRPPEPSDLERTDVAALAAQLRVDSIRAASEAGSGHVTSSLSAADLMAVLLTGYLRYHWSEPTDPDNDHLIFSKGHASPLLYAMFQAAGALEPGEWPDTYRRWRSRLEGHPTPRLPWVDIATGSLGQGLPVAAGVGLAERWRGHPDVQTWVLCGDSEMTEGSMWEAFDMIGRLSLKNVTAIVDVNRLGQSGPTELGWDLEAYAKRVEAFGLVPYVVDGHDLAAVDAAYQFALESPDPTAILARTVKGRGVPEVENKEGWHGKALPAAMAERAIASLGGDRHIRIAEHRPPAARPAAATDAGGGSEPPRYDIGSEVATRTAYGAALAALGARDDIVALDAEVANSTNAEDFAKAHPDRFVQAYIAECQLVATAIGMAVVGYRPFASTFAAFTARAFDFIRMAAVSRANIVICGSHAGVEIGADGPSQMALEDIAALRTVHGSTVLYPSDATSCAALVAEAADRGGVVYLRTTRGAYPVLYPAGEAFPIGGCKVHQRSDRPDVTIVAAGVTLHMALAAADLLGADGIGAQVIDAYSVKPLDIATIRECVERSAGRLIVAEDHHPEGGLGSAVLEALAEGDDLAGLSMAHLAVRTMPGSATPQEQLLEAELDAAAIVAAAHDLIDRKPAAAQHPSAAHERDFVLPDPISHSA